LEVFPQGLNVLSQDVVYLGGGFSVPNGHGKVEKLQCAFQLSHNHGYYYWNCVLKIECDPARIKTIPQGLKSAAFSGFIGTAEAVPVQNSGKRKQCAETSQLKACPFKEFCLRSGLREGNTKVELGSKWR
jgi:hypothetical protein